MSNKDTVAGLGIGVGAGLLIGLVLGVLYAPKSGSDMRRHIRNKAGKFAGDVRAKIGKATLSDVKGEHSGN